MDDWQDEAFSNRRLPHGRSKKGGKAGGRKGAGTFDPRQALGAYELSGKAIERLAGDEGSAVFEIHGLTESPGGLIGSIAVADRLKAVILLAGSRRLLSQLVADAEEDEEDEDEEDHDVEDRAQAREDDAEHSESEQAEGADDDEAETAIEEQDRRDNERVQAFEKNSFRSPKFWLRWQGDLVGEEGGTVRVNGQGYIVFSGNDCKGFQGTLSCSHLEWEDVAIKGRKVTAKAKPCPYSWSDFAMA